MRQWYVSSLRKNVLVSYCVLESMLLTQVWVRTRAFEDMREGKLARVELRRVRIRRSTLQQLGQRNNELFPVTM